MREIKFRAWNEKAGDWYSSSIIKEFGLRFKDKYLLQQFTGLLDKNGTEIYEGDIVNVKDNKNYQGVEVAYGDLGFQLNTKNGFCTDFDADEWEHFEIIGNIYESPELLKNATN